MERTVFHLALRSDWDSARDSGEYRVSTLGRSLDDVGFVHCSATREQVLGVAARFYAHVSEPMVLLTVDVDRVGSEVRDELVGDPPDPFPHVYGPIPVASVLAVDKFERGADGAFAWPSRET